MPRALRQTDAPTLSRLFRRWFAVVGDPNFAALIDHIHPIVLARDGESLAEFRGSRTEVSQLPRLRAPFLHRLDALERRQRSDQNRHTFTLPPTHGIRTPVHAVREVNVQMPRRTEHGGVALRLSAVGMTTRIFETGVGLDLDDASRESATDEDLVQELRRHEARIALVERSAQDVVYCAQRMMQSRKGMRTRPAS